MRRIAVLAGVIALASASMAAAAGGAAKIGLRMTGRGKLIANAHGFTVYAFTRDRGGTDHCVKIRACTSTWHPVMTKGKPVAGTGVSGGLLGTTKLSGGKLQVTYDGHPIYTYAGDTGPGQTDYIGISQFGGRWEALTAKGKLIK